MNNLIPAAQYLRMSSDQPKWSFPYQTAAIESYAKAFGFTVVKTYEDPAVSGLTLKHRKGLAQLLRDVVNNTAEFKAILVYDVSRWGRFQDSDESAHYEFICRSAGIPVHYCAEAFSNDGSVSNSIMKALKRVMAGEYSRELSARIARAKRIGTERGFRVGGRAGYGLRRMLVSEDRTPIRLLVTGEYVESGRVVLVPGPAREVAIVREIYRRVIFEKEGAMAIARDLNRRHITPPGDSRPEWSYEHVLEILTNPKYAGQAVGGRVTQRLKGPVIPHPPEQWIVMDSAFVPIIEPETFVSAQKALRRRTFYKSNEELLTALRNFLSRTGVLSEHKIDTSRELPSVRTYVARFGSMKRVYELIGYDYSGHVLTHPQMRKIMSQSRFRREKLREGFLQEMRKTFGNEMTVVRKGALDRPILSFSSGLRISVLICPATKTPLGYPRWRIPPLRGPQSQVTVLCLCNVTNSAFQDFYLVPSADRGRCSVVQRTNWQLRIGTRMRDLSRLPALATRVWKRTTRNSAILGQTS
jgi:DNA invertase Pin-like site-specific DNA recombinase